jgi:hypothetical protein
MSEAKTISAADESDDDRLAVIDYIEKIDRIRRQMAEDEKEIGQLKTETREILTRLEAA